MKKTVAALAILATFMLAGCSTPENAGDNSNQWYITTLNDPTTGKQVSCAINGWSERSGIDCNWEGATK